MATPRHQDLWRQPGVYAAFPVIYPLRDGRLSLFVPNNSYKDHYLFGTWRVLVSDDEGENWHSSDDPAVPFNWPGEATERYYRYAGTTPDGELVTAGTPAWQEWPVERRREAEDAELMVREHPGGDTTRIAVASNHWFVQRSRDQGKTWTRQDWKVPDVGHLKAFPRWTVLSDGTILVPTYGGPADGGDRKIFVLRSPDGGRSWWLVALPGAFTRGTGEAAVVEVSPGRVLVHIRQQRDNERLPLLESWSDDGGRSWSHPVETAIWGLPPHLLRLRDGRIVCTYGHRRAPFGVQAVISEDGGRSWDVDRKVIVRDDGETPDLGYPQSIELSDGSIYTVYYLTKGGTTFSAATRWRPD